MLEIGWLNREASREKAVQLMQEQISHVGAAAISPHCDVRILAINIDPASLDDQAAFVAAAGNQAEVTKSLAPQGSEHPEVHLEITRS